MSIIGRPGLTTPAEQSSPQPDSTVLVLVRDLMFSGRIGATARALNVPVKLIRDPAALVGAKGHRLIVDLNQEGALDAAVAWKGRCSGEVVGFVSHVDVETIARAKAAGIDQILPRSRFVEVLGSLLRRG